jgi:potassium/chloride transporter 9
LGTSNLTRGADGSQLRGKETFQDLFGILFPATGGIFAGASMSGDLKNPSKSIPKGTLYGLATTFILYTLVIFAMAATITRASFARNANIIQETNVSGLVILAGELASSLFSTLMGVIGSAKLLQALARDNDALRLESDCFFRHNDISCKFIQTLMFFAPSERNSSGGKCIF